LNRNRGKSGHYIYGGTHLTYYPYVPQLLIKSFTCTECGPILEQVARVFFNVGNNFWQALKDYMADDKTVTHRMSDKRGKLRAGVEYYPWALRCNPLRYKPTAFSVPDDRLFLTEAELPFDKC